MRIFGVIGWKNNGKTTLVERLVGEIRARGHSVSTIKHAHHAFDVDQPGKDSYRHRQAGAGEVLVSGGQRWALMHELNGAAEPTLEELLSKLEPVDLVIVEGFKQDAHDKLEVYREESGRGLIVRDDDRICMVASDTPIDDLAIPVIDLDDVAAITDFVLRHVGLVTEAV